MAQRVETAHGGPQRHGLADADLPGQHGEAGFGDDEADQSDGLVVGQSPVEVLGGDRWVNGVAVKPKCATQRERFIAAHRLVVVVGPGSDFADRELQRQPHRENGKSWFAGKVGDMYDDVGLHGVSRSVGA
jgi:hypothetical protein